MSWRAAWVVFGNQGETQVDQGLHGNPDDVALLGLLGRRKYGGDGCLLLAVD